MTCVLENNTFAALGHGITDVDTGLLIELNNGGLYQATVNKIVSGKKGTPGELSGIVHLNNNNKIGSVLTNNHWGNFRKGIRPCIPISGRKRNLVSTETRNKNRQSIHSLSAWQRNKRLRNHNR